MKKFNIDMNNKWFLLTLGIACFACGSDDDIAGRVEPCSPTEDTIQTYVYNAADFLNNAEMTGESNSVSDWQKMIDKVSKQNSGGGIFCSQKAVGCVSQLMKILPSVLS